MSAVNLKKPAQKEPRKNYGNLLSESWMKRGRDDDKTEWMYLVRVTDDEQVKWTEGTRIPFYAINSFAAGDYAVSTSFYDAEGKAYEEKTIQPATLRILKTLFQHKQENLVLALAMLPKEKEAMPIVFSVKI